MKELKNLDTQHYVEYLLMEKHKAPSIDRFIDKILECMLSWNISAWLEDNKYRKKASGLVFVVGARVLHLSEKVFEAEQEMKYNRIKK